MQINIQQLNSHLKKSLAPIYLIHGEETLLIDETKSAIRQAALAAQYTDRNILQMDSHFDTSKFLALTQNLSLFSEKRLIEINFPAAKFDKNLMALWQQYFKSQDTNNLIILTTSKLSSAQQKTAWYKMFDQHSVVIPIWPVTLRDLPSWIAQRLKQKNLQADNDSIRLLAELTEGNLLATQQAIEKLQLLYEKNIMITTEKMAAAVCDNNHFNIFDLSQYALQGDSKHVARIINHLEHDDTEPTLVLWVLAKEIRLLIQYSQQMKQGRTITEILNKEWTSRKPLLTNALKRHTLTTLRPLIYQATQIDKIIKGQQGGQVWQELMRLALSLANTEYAAMSNMYG